MKELIYLELLHDYGNETYNVVIGGLGIPTLLYNKKTIGQLIASTTDLTTVDYELVGKLIRKELTKQIDLGRFTV